MRALLAAGVAVEGDGEDTPLVEALRACSHGNDTDAIDETIGALVSAGADVNRKGSNDNTPLLHAAQFCGDQVISALLAAGADMDVVNGSGVTPLTMAVFSSRFEAAEALVAKGARLTEEQAAIVSVMPDPRAKEIAKKGTARKK